MLVAAGFLAGCGGGEDTVKKDPIAVKSDTNTTSAPAQSYSGFTQDEARTLALMQASLTEVMERMKYGDKSGLYENEFYYLTDDVSLDDYLGYEQVKAAGPDSVVSVEVTGFEMREDGSAIIDLVVHFEGPTGVKTDMKDKIRMYQRDGEWFKPYVSRINFQSDYDDIIRVADSAAEAEAKGN